MTKDRISYAVLGTVSTTSLVIVGLIVGVAAMPQPRAASQPEVVTSGRPMNKVALLLEERYAQAVAYEDPIWLWKGDIEASAKARGLYPKERSFFLPFELRPDRTAIPDVASLRRILGEALVAYHEQTDGPRFEILTSTADLTQSLTSDPMYFPHFADGGGYTTALVLLNTSNGIETGTFRILDDLGAALIVNQVGSTADSSFKYSIPSGGAFRFQTDGFPSTTKVGWALLTPDAGTSTPVGAGVFGYNSGNVLVTESGIPAAASTTHARVYVDLSGGHNTGLAIANPAESSATISIKAYRSDGTSGIGTSQGLPPLPAKGHSAKFAGEFVSGLPAEFTGVLDISSAVPFAALTMRSLINERADFLLTAFPIADMNRAAPAPIVFPQIADGGGYVTQFILLNPGGTTSTTLAFYGEDGTPLVIGKY